MILVVNNTLVDDVLQTVATRRIVEFLRTTGVKHTLVTGLQAARSIECDLGQVSGIILSGSDLRLTEPISVASLSQSSSLLMRCRGDIPVLGVCFGHQLLAVLHGGVLQKLSAIRRGTCAVNPTPNPLVPPGNYMQAHHDYVAEAPPGWRVLATSSVDGTTVIECMQHEKKPMYGVQFHPELSGSDGHRVLHNFLVACGVTSLAEEF